MSSRASKIVHFPSNSPLHPLFLARRITNPSGLSTASNSKYWLSRWFHEQNTCDADMRPAGRFCLDDQSSGYTRSQSTSPRNSIASLVFWRQQLPTGTKRWINIAWVILILGFAALHALHLSADFPNHTPWMHDWAKYTDEGWYGNAAIRAHLFGNWYLPGDFNPAVALPVWPYLEWLLFFLTGVSAEAARGLAIAFFFANLLLSYWLLRLNGPRWVALFALTLLVTSPFLYSFMRLAILEPLLTTLTLLALNLCVRLARFRRPILGAFWIGLLFALMMLTKTTAIFLLPALAWAVLLPSWRTRGSSIRCALVITGTSAVAYAAWLLLVTELGL